MNVFLPQAPTLGFKGHPTWLSGLAPDMAGSLITAATDIALVVDRDGIVNDVALSGDELLREGCHSWVGRPIADIVTIESRPKVADLIAQAGNVATVHFREVNHPSIHGPDLPVRYSAIQVDSEGTVLLLGRDLRHFASLQQRLVEAQQAMEREYARLRMAETRYRMLFHLASEPVIILDATTLRISEANPVAQRELNIGTERLTSLTLPSLFLAADGRALEQMLRTARLSGKSEEIEITLATMPRRFSVFASSFRQDGTAYLLVRLTPLTRDDAQGAEGGVSRHVVSMVEQFPDGFVVISPDLKVLEANRAFLDMAQIDSKQQVLGQPLERWLGRPGIDLPLLMVTLTEHGVVRNFSTIVRGAFGGVEEVELSAVPALTGATPSYGFVIRSQGVRSVRESQRGRTLPRSIEHLADLVGRVSLKDLVRETTDVIEKLCIEAALELSKDNRASAAQMLGLSRQSFYAKLRRHGLGDLDDDDIGELN